MLLLRKQLRRILFMQELTCSFDAIKNKFQVILLELARYIIFFIFQFLNLLCLDWIHVQCIEEPISNHTLHCIFCNRRSSWLVSFWCNLLSLCGGLLTFIISEILSITHRNSSMSAEPTKWGSFKFSLENLIALVPWSTHTY